jgi:hypothetical protein
MAKTPGRIFIVHLTEFVVDGAHLITSIPQSTPQLLTSSLVEILRRPSEVK